MQYIILSLVLLCNIAILGQEFSPATKHYVKERIKDSLTIERARIDGLHSLLRYEFGYTISDSLNVLRSSLDKDLGSTFIIDGWYAQNITTTPTKQLLYRGLGTLDYYFRPTQNVQIKKVVFESTNFGGTINIYVYKNGFWTGIVLVNKNGQTKNSYLLGKYSLILTENDYLTFKYDCALSSYNPNIKVYIEAETVPEYTGDLTIPPTYRVEWEAVGGGKITVTTIDNDTLKSGVKVIEGNELIIIAEPWSNKDFWLWTGIDCPDSNRVNDTIRVIVTNNLHLRARFKAKTRTYQVVLADPYINGDTSHAHYCYQSFMSAWNEINDYLFESNTISILKYNYGHDVEAAFRMADSVGAMVIFLGVSGFVSINGEALAQKYYPIQTIVPTGANEIKKVKDYADLPAQIFTGVGLANDIDPYSLPLNDLWRNYCVTATDVEIRGYDRVSQPVQLVDSVNIYDVPKRYQTVRVSNDTVFGKYFKKTSAYPRIPGDNTGRSDWRFLKLGQRLVIDNKARAIVNIINDTMLVVSSSYNISGNYSAYFIQNLSSFSNPDVAAHYSYFLYYVTPTYMEYEDWYAARVMMRYGIYGEGSTFVMKMRDMDNGYNQINIGEYFDLSTMMYIMNLKNIYGKYYFRSIDPYLRR